MEGGRGGRQTDRQTDRQTERQTEVRQTLDDTHKTNLADCRGVAGYCCSSCSTGFLNNSSA